MGAGSALARLFRPQPIAETTPVEEAKTPPPQAIMPEYTAAQIRRKGFEFGVPLTSEMPSAQMAATAERQQMLQHLHDAFNTCTWMSAAINVIARTVTAGGLEIVPDDDIPEDEVPEEPPEVKRLRRLVKFTNPTEDMIQLLRMVIIDLMLFGDSYLEVIRLFGEPVALYLLDATTMTVISDQHGEVTGYRQDVDGLRQASFNVEDVIHISLDAPRGGLYGTSPAQLALLPTTAWIFTMATIQETFRRGDPPRIHVDLAHYEDNDVQRWREQHQVYNMGPKAVGNPLITTGGGVITVLDNRKVTDYLDAARDLRDQIIASFGVPPAKVGIIETGNIGGGSGEAQNKSFQVNTIIPIANLLLEKLNYHLVMSGFGITGWHLEFAEVDFRDSQTVENVRETRLKNGAYSVNDWRAEIGKPPIDGGDINIIETRQGIVAWDDMEAMSKASIGNKAAPLTAAGVNGYVPGLPDAEEPEPPQLPPMAAAMALAGGKPGVAPVPDMKPNAPRSPEDQPGLSGDATQGAPPKETAYGRDTRALSESWERSYRARRKAALKALPGPGRGHRG
jgi:HK97 family phage portal protein